MTNYKSLIFRPLLAAQGEAENDFAKFMSRTQISKAKKLAGEYWEVYGPGWENQYANDLIL